jgi:cytochrome c553
MVKPRTVRNAALTTAGVVLLLCVWQSLGAPHVAAQAAQGAQTPAASAPPFDPYDRVARLWYRQRLATSGVERGREIFYMSCWMCHNEYTIDTTKIKAPRLSETFSRPGITDEQLMGIMRRGGLRMPAYPPSLLSDQDLRDVVAFLRQTCAASAPQGGSCYDEMNPPANPRYKAQ